MSASSDIAEVLLDPDSAHYQKVVDLAYAPQDERGRVHYETDFCLLKPVDMRRGNRSIFDVVNRGDKRAVAFFNDAAASNDPVSHADAGNGYLMQLGYDILWCGWQADVLPGDGRLTIAVPIARDGDREITGTVREEIIVDEDGIVSNPSFWKGSNPQSSGDLVRHGIGVVELSPVRN